MAHRSQLQAGLQYTQLKSYQPPPLNFLLVLAAGSPKNPYPLETGKAPKPSLECRYVSSTYPISRIYLKSGWSYVRRNLYIQVCLSNSFRTTLLRARVKETHPFAPLWQLPRPKEKIKSFISKSHVLSPSFSYSSKPIVHYPEFLYMSHGLVLSRCLDLSHFQLRQSLCSHQAHSPSPSSPIVLISVPSLSCLPYLAFSLDEKLSSKDQIEER